MELTDLIIAKYRQLCKTHNLKTFEFEAEDLVFVNGFIKALKYWSSFDIDDNMMIRALDVAIDEYVKCIEEDKNYRDLFDKSFMFVSLPKIEEQEGKDE